ncbi:MAG: hypothetical protein IPJ23_00095 [Ignavibacteriales bacterium]|nr:hypothetical protein [Ignavibacteriales bacterium]
MKLKISYLVLFTLIVNSFTANATIRFVSKTGTSTPPYTSWETAADSIQKCINICVDGDTVYVDVGTYIEKVTIDRYITLIGMSMDSVIIDGANAIQYNIIYVTANATMENFTVIGNGTAVPVGIETFNANILLRSVRIKDLEYGINIQRSTSLVENCIISNCGMANIRDECAEDTCHSIYRNNILASKNALGAAYFSFGGYPTFTNNIVIDEGQTTLTGIFSGQKPGAIIKNNLIYGYKNEGIGIGTVTNDTTHLISNVITNIGNNFGGISTSTGNRTKTENNIIKNSYRAFYTFNTNPFRADYNLFWKIQELIAGQTFVGDSNIVAEPMFVNDTIPRIGGTYDFRLQKYSPAIDKGNPNILDTDGTRSDIGMYGGPFGETYTYQDLSPLAPRNLSAVVDSNYITVRWNRNTEADTSFYKVYRDTVINFTIDSTKLISSSSDSFFVQVNPHINTRYVYKVICVDNQGNESQPSQELVVNITSVSMDEYPMAISDYVLYQNYPNPFNPSTKIGYQLKERAYVKMMVYDIKGELISVLVNKEQNAGYYEVEFNVGNGLPSVPNLASGIYLYRIEVIGEGNIPVYTEMKKMLMIK